MDNPSPAWTFHPLSLSGACATEVRIAGHHIFLSETGSDPNVTYLLGTDVEGPLMFSVTVLSSGAVSPAIYLDHGEGFSEASKINPLCVEDGRHRFIIDEGRGLQRIRYDPSELACTICIGSVQLRSLADDEKLKVLGCSVTHLMGMTWNFCTGMSLATTTDPQIHLTLSEEVKALPFAVVEFRAMSNASALLDPTLYLSDNQSSAVSLWRDGDTFKALILAPGEFPTLRLDPTSSAGRFHITHLQFRSLQPNDGHRDVATLYAKGRQGQHFLATQTSLLLNQSETSASQATNATSARDGREEWIQSGLPTRSAKVLADIATRLSTKRRTKSLLGGPLISILTPVYDVDLIWLRLMVESVSRQTYANWELCLVDDCSPNEKVRELLSELAAQDYRLKLRFREINGGISAATNDALEMAGGTYIALVDNDDVLTCDALEAMVDAILANDGPDWLYSDEFKIDQEGRPSQLFAKPDWSPIMLFNYMYTGHLSLYRTELVRSIGGFRSEYDFSQDYDLALRIGDHQPRVVHVEKYLYGWRMIEGSGSQGGKPTARLTNIAALQDAADRRGWSRVALPLSTANRLVRSEPIAVKVSIIIPSDNVDNIATSIRSITADSSYDDYEIIVVARTDVIEKISELYKSCAHWVAYDKSYSFSDKCNVGAEAATGDILIFFNDDVRVITADWIEALLEVLSIPGVGAVGPKLLYEDGLIQHAGMVTGVRRLVGTAFHSYPSNTSAHFNMAQCVREVSLICAALIALPVDVFHSIGGFDVVNTPISHSDVDLCFKVREAGLSCVYTPYATLLHIGHASLAEVDAKEKAEKVYKKNTADIFLLKRWAPYLAHDPYFTASMRDLLYIDSEGAFALDAPAFERPNDGCQSTLIVSHDLSESGAPKVVFDLALSMKRFGHFVVVISPVDGPFRGKLIREGIMVIIDANVLGARDDSMALARNFDSVIANTALCWRIVVELARYTQVFWYIHETELIRHLADKYEDFSSSLLMPKTLWVGSERAAQAVLHYGADPRILEYGVDDTFEVFNSKNALRVVLIGSFEPRKGHDLLVLGVKQLSDETRQRACFRFFGRTLDTAFRDAVENLARGTGEIEISNELSYRRYREEIGAADIVVVPSRDDTLPLVSLDALALGKALICSRTTGTSDYLENGKSALLLEHNSPAEIADCLQRLINSAEMRRTLGEGARAVFEKTFTQSAFKTRLAEQFEQPAAGEWSKADLVS